jgi:hypothetical protein
MPGRDSLASINEIDGNWPQKPDKKQKCDGKLLATD